MSINGGAGSEMTEKESMLIQIPGRGSDAEFTFWYFIFKFNPRNLIPALNFCCFECFSVTE